MCAAVSVKTGVSAVFMGQQREASLEGMEKGEGKNYPLQIAAALQDIIIEVPVTFLRSL
jgi:hypothetical protein